MSSKIVEYGEVPHELTVTAREWFDGGNSAMYRFSRGEPVDPRKLLKEVRVAVGVNLDDKWRGRLEALEVFAENEATRARAKDKLSEAVMACFNAGMEAWQVEEVFRTATQDTRREIEDAAIVAPAAPGR